MWPTDNGYLLSTCVSAWEEISHTKTSSQHQRASYKLYFHGRLPCFFNQTLQLLFYFAARFVRLLFEGSVCSFGKPGDINDGWIGYIRLRQWRLLDAVSSTHNLSLLLSAVRTTCTTQTVLVLAWWQLPEIIRTCVCHIYWLQLLFEGCIYFVQELQIVRPAVTIWGRWLFEGGSFEEIYSVCSMLVCWGWTRPIYREHGWNPSMLFIIILDCAMTKEQNTEQVYLHFWCQKRWPSYCRAHLTVLAHKHIFVVQITE